MHQRSALPLFLLAGCPAARPPRTWRACPPATASTPWAWVSLRESGSGGAAPGAQADFDDEADFDASDTVMLINADQFPPAPVPPSVLQPLSPPPWRASASLRCSTAAGRCWAPPACSAWRSWVRLLLALGCNMPAVCVVWSRGRRIRAAVSCTRTDHSSAPPPPLFRTQATATGTTPPCPWLRAATPPTLAPPCPLTWAP